MSDDNDLPVTTERLSFSNLYIFVDAEGKHGYFDEAGLVGASGFQSRDEAIFRLGQYCTQLDMHNHQRSNMNGEAVITINGDTLQQYESATIRVAVSILESVLRNNKLGTDEVSRTLTANYLKAVSKINRCLFR